MMYHHVNSDRCSNDLEIFEKHLQYIAKRFTTVFPTMEKLPRNPICLVFDDGYYDFYAYIYPLLKKYQLKALLAVVPKYILDKTDRKDSERLNFKHNDLFEAYEHGAFCTYNELKEMIDSGLVQIASHSYSHKNLLESGCDLSLELFESKKILEQKLNVTVQSFVFPFGKYNQSVLDETKKQYSYAFRIGNGVHKDFSGVHGVIYRIDGDGLKNENAVFGLSSMLKYRMKTLIKMIVGNKE